MPQAFSQFTEHLIAMPVPDFYTTGVSAGDLDGDGDDDVVASTMVVPYDANLLWYANDGTGAFGPPQQIHQGGIRSGETAVADLDGDGDLDIVATWNWGQDCYVYYNNGSGSFSIGPMIGHTSTYYRWTFQVGDLTGDGWADVMLGNDDNLAGLWLITNDGTGGFLPQQHINNSMNGPISLRMIDVDIDGDLDVIYISSSYGIVWQGNLGGGNLSSPVPIRTGYWGSWESVNVADLNSDGQPDVAYRWGPYSQDWAENDGADFSSVHVIGPGSNTTSWPQSDDLDGDGDQDLLATKPISGDTIEWYQNDGAGNFSGPLVISHTFTAPATTTGDPDGDGVKNVIAGGLGISWFGQPGIVTNDEARPKVELGVSLFPNPFTEETRLRIDGALNNNIEFRLLDAHGHIMLSSRLTGYQSLLIKRGDLAPGLYLAQVFQGHEVIGTCPVIAE